MAQHSVWRLIVIFLTIIVYFITLVFNGLAGRGGAGVFHNSTGVVSNFYYTEVTPAGWTFGLIWPIIYVYQATWLAYATSTICRRSMFGYLYVDPEHIPLGLFPAFMVNNISNVVWLILWDRFLPQYALISLTISALSLYIALLLSFLRLSTASLTLVRDRRQVDLWLTRILVQNGLAFYATWVTIATIINLIVVMTYFLNVNQSVASTVGLCILLLLLFVWYYADMVPFDGYVRYTFTPYLVVILAMSGSINKNWNTQNSNSAIITFILAVTCLGLVIKIFVARRRHRSRALFDEEISFYQKDSNYSTHEYESIICK